MSEAENTQTAKDAYAAFGRGDIPAVLGVMTDDIEWVFPGPADVLPNAGTFTGREAVGAWFGTLDANLEFQVFEPREFIAQGDKLVALVHIENTVRSSGGRNGRGIPGHHASRGRGRGLPRTVDPRPEVVPNTPGPPARRHRVTATARGCCTSRLRHGSMCRGKQRPGPCRRLPCTGHPQMSPPRTRPARVPPGLPGLDGLADPAQASVRDPKRAPGRGRAA
jgi:uncharacterized protein